MKPRAKRRCVAPLRSKCWLSTATIIPPIRPERIAIAAYDQTTLHTVICSVSVCPWLLSSTGSHPRAPPARPAPALNKSSRWLMEPFIELVLSHGHPDPLTHHNSRPKAGKRTSFHSQPLRLGKDKIGVSIFWSHLGPEFKIPDTVTLAIRFRNSVDHARRIFAEGMWVPACAWALRGHDAPLAFC